MNKGKDAEEGKGKGKGKLEGSASDASDSPNQNEGNDDGGDGGKGKGGKLKKSTRQKSSNGSEEYDGPDMNEGKEDEEGKGKAKEKVDRRDLPVTLRFPQPERRQRRAGKGPQIKEVIGEKFSYRDEVISMQVLRLIRWAKL